MLGEKNLTNRGFGRVEFNDCYGHPCYLQNSSVADYSAVWLGIADPDPKIMKSDAIKKGIPVSGEICGWVPYPIPDEVLINTQMHLNVEQVKGLIERLQNWLDSGQF